MPQRLCRLKQRRPDRGPSLEWFAAKFIVALLIVMIVMQLYFASADFLFLKVYLKVYLGALVREGATQRLERALPSSRS